MRVAALKQKVLEEPDKTAMFQEMLNICAFNSTCNVLNILTDCNYLPIKTQTGITEWFNHSTDFAIVDRRKYKAMLENKVRVLDFSLEELHSLQPFLLALGLEIRYMSIAVEEKTTAQDNELHAQLTSDIRKKAYAIFR